MPKGIRRNPRPDEEMLSFRIANLVRLGKTDMQIAKELNIALQTVYNHVSDLYSAAGIDGRPKGKWELRSGDVVGRRSVLRHFLNGDFDD